MVDKTNWFKMYAWPIGILYLIHCFRSELSYMDVSFSSHALLSILERVIGPMFIALVCQIFR